MKYKSMPHYLKRPEGLVDIVLDTDAYNEIDDQFAIAYILKSPEKFNVKAICAAPFYNEKSSGPEDGMRKSFDEVIKITKLAERTDVLPLIYEGSTGYLADEKTPVISQAAEKIIALAMDAKPGQKLYVVAIGAITNVASAILLKPEIADKIVILWLGGHSLEWHDTKEFNMIQDVAAARVVLGSGAPLSLFPCMGVVSSLTTTEPELKYHLAGKNSLCDYLAKNTIKEGRQSGLETWSRPIWDIAPAAWFFDEEFMLSRPESSPIPSFDGYYQTDKRRHMIEYVYYINRDLVFQDLFSRLLR